jgi:hypothetical protein
MPTVLRIAGWRVVVYANDHPPARVHVLGAGWVVVVDLNGPALREVIGCDERTARGVLSALTPHLAGLLADWRRIHG